MEENNDDIDLDRKDRESSISSVKSIKDDNSAINLDSKSLDEELSLDLPQFTYTKYLPFTWRISHSLFYLLYSCALFGANIWYIRAENFISYNFLSLISHISYFFSTFMEWFHFKRGCIGRANYNSAVKSNINKSLRAKILRSEQGWKYFFSFFASMILIYGNIYYILYNNKNNEDELEKGVIPNFKIWNIYSIGSMINSLAQILKIEKILTEIKQYMAKNDLYYCLIEYFFIFWLFSLWNII